jgi:hypothetical protein
MKSAVNSSANKPKSRDTDTTDKPNNPKDLVGSHKVPLHLFPTTARAAGSIAFLNGALKYGRANFRVVGVKASIYYDAACRHLDAWFEGEEYDPDDGVQHLSAALACVAILIDAKVADKLNDDRMVNGDHYREFIDDLSTHVPRLKELHTRYAPKHYTIACNTIACNTIAGNITDSNADGAYSV